MLKGVNDSQGNPYFQKVYHGSSYTLSEFKPGNNNAHGFGVYFAKDKSKTDKYKRSPYAFFEFKPGDNYADGYVL